LRFVAHEKRAPGLPRLSEKQYQFSTSSSRNCRFFLVRRPEASKSGGLGRCVSGAGEAQNSESETNISRKRKERFRDPGRKSLRSLGREMSRFREIVCFQGLGRLFVSRFAACALSAQKGLSPADRGALRQAQGRLFEAAI
jgi:hypothetical protein